MLTALITAFIAPLAAQTASERADHEGDARARRSRRGLLREVDRVDHAPGATVPRKQLQVFVRADQPEQADEQDHARKEGEQRAERDLLREAHAVVREELLRGALDRASHSRALRRCGPDGTCPTSASLARSAAVDKLEAARLHLRFPSRPRRASRRIVAPSPPASTNPVAAPPAASAGSFARSFAGHVGRLPPELVDRGRELLALLLDLAADVFCRAWHHSLLDRGRGQLGLLIACCGTGGVPFLIDLTPSSPSTATSTKRKSVTISSASQVARKVASPAAIVAKRNPKAKTAKTAAAGREADPDADRGELLLELERRQLELEPDERAGGSATAFTAPARPRCPSLVARVAWPRQSTTFARK